MRTYEEVQAIVRRQSSSGPNFTVGTCLKQCRTVYGIAAQYPSAAEAWKHAEFKHLGTNGPKGAFEFWTGGSHGYGHIAISAGGGWCWSTDINRPGRWDLVHASEIASKWNMKHVGWSEDVNGKRVITYVPATRWTVLRRKLIDLIDSPEALQIPKRRKLIWAGLTATRYWLSKTPEH